MTAPLTGCLPCAPACECRVRLRRSSQTDLSLITSVLPPQSPRQCEKRSRANGGLEPSPSSSISKQADHHIPTAGARRRKLSRNMIPSRAGASQPIRAPWYLACIFSIGCLRLLIGCAYFGLQYSPWAIGDPQRLLTNDLFPDPEKEGAGHPERITKHETSFPYSGLDLERDV